MRVGEILLEHRWVDQPSLQRAVSEQRHTGKRLCSLLISRGLLDADHASRALGEQHEVAAALQRHLRNRDHTVVSLLPTVIARTQFALPIGRNRSEELIVCVRDPKPQLLALLNAALRGQRVVLAVAPATQLEHLIDLAYEPAPNDEFDVDMSTGTGQVAKFVDVDVNSGPNPMPDFGSMTLVELDDSRVAKDLSQSQMTSQTGSRPLTIPPLSSVTPIASKRTLDDTLAAIEAAPSRDSATESAMRFAHSRWVAALLLAIREGAALGHRGHGTQLSLDAVQAIAIPLGSSSIVKTAHDFRRVATEPLTGAVQERLSRLLGQPRAPMAAPVVVANRVACIFTVGDALGGGDPASDLERLANALGDAYARVLRDKKS